MQLNIQHRQNSCQTVIYTVLVAVIRASLQHGQVGLLLHFNRAWWRPVLSARLKQNRLQYSRWSNCQVFP